MGRVAGRREDDGGGDAQPLCFAKGVGFSLVVLDDDLLGAFSKKRGDLGMVGLKKRVGFSRGETDPACFLSSCRSMLIGGRLRFRIRW